VTIPKTAEHPRAAAQYVAFLVENILPGRIVRRCGDGCRIAVGAATLFAARAISGSDVLACIRAEEVELYAAADAAPGGCRVGSLPSSSSGP
jgi:hypothetical protein